MLLGVYGGINASLLYGGINARKYRMAAMPFKNIYMYFSKVYFTKVYPTCASSKLCESHFCSCVIANAQTSLL